MQRGTRSRWGTRFGQCLPACQLVAARLPARNGVPCTYRQPLLPSMPQLLLLAYDIVQGKNEAHEAWPVEAGEPPSTASIKPFPPQQLLRPAAERGFRERNPAPVSRPTSHSFGSSWARARRMRNRRCSSTSACVPAASPPAAATSPPLSAPSSPLAASCSSQCRRWLSRQPTSASSAGPAAGGAACRVEARVGDEGQHCTASPGLVGCRNWREGAKAPASSAPSLCTCCPAPPRAHAPRACAAVASAASRLGSRSRARR